jgi:septum formation protein
VPELVLASASPARLATLHAAGVRPAVIVSEVDEDALVRACGLTDARDVALLLARAKAQDVARVRTAGLVLGCDSVLELAGQVLGKPADAADAVARWRAMRGRSGTLHTGHWLIDTRRPGDLADRPAVGDVASTIVHFADITDDEIHAYVQTGEPLQVAGGFTIDGRGGPFVRGIEGDHHTVVGVSLPLLRELLGRLGVGWFDIVD